MQSGSALPKEHGQRRTSYLLLAAGCVLLTVTAVMGINDNPPAIALGLLGALALVLGIVYFFAQPGQRKPALQLLYWAPRALCIVFALFIGMFALDVFGEVRGFWHILLALAIHLIPAFFLLIVLWASWRREWIGGVIFPLLGILYIVSSWNRPFAHLSTLLLIAGPPIVTGALFWLNWYYRRELRGKD
jgi:hypothetical protein